MYSDDNLFSTALWQIVFFYYAFVLYIKVVKIYVLLAGCRVIGSELRKVAALGKMFLIYTTFYLFSNAICNLVKLVNCELKKSKRVDSNLVLGYYSK